MKTIAQVLIAYLEEQDKWINSYEFINRNVLVKGKGYWCGSSADRTARKLAERGLIAKRHHEGYAQYKAKNTIPTQLAMQESHNVIT